MTAPAELVAFIDREHPRVVRAVSLLLGDRMVAEEVAQEALLRAIARWERVSRLESPGGWVHRVALNLATSQLRRWRLERRARARLGSEPAAATADPAEILAVRAAVRDLPTAQRRLLVLRHVLDWTAREIAEQEGASEAAVRQRLHRARVAVRQRLEAGTVERDHEEATDAR